MKEYSKLFKTIEDTEEATLFEVYAFDCDGHRIVRHRFKVVWDEDRDDRVIGLLETITLDMEIHRILAIGENQGSFDVITSYSDDNLSAIKRIFKDTITLDGGDQWTMCGCHKYTRRGLILTPASLFPFDWLFKQDLSIDSKVSNINRIIGLNTGSIHGVSLV